MKAATLAASTEDIPGDAETRIHDAILHAVLTQKLAADTRLPELTLSRIFDVNRSVVRRALSRLEADRVVVMRRNQSAVVISPGADETRQLFAARRHVEAEVMRLTAGSLDAPACRELRAIVEREHSAHAEGVHDDRIHLSLEFHQYLGTACPNHVLGQMLRDLILRTSVAVALYKVPGMAACYRAGDHRRIAEALIDGQGEAAAAAACRHLDYLEERLNYATRIHRVDLETILTG